MTMKTLLTLTAVVLLGAFAPVANCAAIQIQYQITGLAAVTCASASAGPVSCADVTIGFHDVGLGANSDSPGTATFSDLTSADVDLINNSGTSQTVQIQISANGFTLPTTTLPNVTLLSHVGGTVVAGGSANVLSFQSCVDPTNTLRSVGSFGVACSAGSFASGLSTPAITGTGSYSADRTSLIGPLGPAPYALQEAFVITLSAGGEINWSSSTSLTANLTTIVPEPSTSLLVLGVGLVGFGAFGRKRLSRK